MNEIKKNAFVALTLISLVTLLLLAPLSGAAPPKKILVTVSRATTIWNLGTDVWMGGENTWHSRNSAIGGNAYTITSVSQGIYMSGYNRAVVDQNLEIEGLFMGATPMGQGNSRMYSTLNLTDTEGRSGTFEGVLHYSGEMVIYPRAPLTGFLVPYNAVSHGVWHGTGDFKGWTYTVDEEYIDGVSQGMVGYLLIP